MHERGGDVIHPVMVGTAGHIDHGKSTLVRTLTGIDPDRLEEEKRTGMTIDLGFAPLRMADGRVLGMIDVPGHERFVRNMVAGSTGLDLAVLVVAADDSVMPQTREHLNIVDLLGVRSGIVALTKVDLVDEEIAMFAEEEIRELLQGTRLQDAEIVRISSTTGLGIEEFRRKLEALAAAVPPRSAEGPFRMPIQRVFTLKGIGTVITGVPMSGSISVGQTVEILPLGKQSKVRAVQAFGEQVETAVAGHSTALSVPDIKASQLNRGCVASSPGVYRVGDAADIELTLLRGVEPLEHRMPIRFHTGTIECRGVLLLLDRDRAEPGQELTARVLLDEPVCGVFGDRFLLRLQNPVLTVGGGRILRVSEVPRRYRRKTVGDELTRLVEVGPEAGGRVLEELKRVGGEGTTVAALAAALGLEHGAIETALADAGDVVHVHQKAGRVFLADLVEDGRAMIERAVERLLKDRPLAASIKRTQLQSSKLLPQPLIQAVLARMQEQGVVESSAQGRLLFRERLKPLDPADQSLLEKMHGTCVESGFRPLTDAELADAVGVRDKRFQSVLARALDTGLIELVGEHLYAGATVQRALVAIYRNCLRHDEELVIPELRDELGTSRKFLIPLLEYVDGLGLTRLRGGVRRLLPTSPACQQIAEVAAEQA
ncbi:MAG: selenocysteine-specific translation elongation factor [Planctomycetes bacterium]|nr:selenocysteine-specific translation elongation factor [Planctomycetota bacterium]MCB9868472.1 selenocysteine-specific translation elongation factor [Planctomycetota bacterium]